MSFFARQFARALFRWPWYATAFEGELLHRLDLDGVVWQVAAEDGLTRSWELPLWAAAGTDPVLQVPAGWFIDEEGMRRPKLRVLTPAERSGCTLNAIRQRTGAIR